MIAPSIKWQHRAVQLKFDQLSAAAVFTPPCPYWSSILLLHIRVKQPHMWNWPPSCLMKNGRTFTSTPFYTFIIPLATGRTSAWIISAWKFRTPGGDCQKSFWLLVLPRSISGIFCDWSTDSGITRSIILHWKLWPELLSKNLKPFLINKTAQHPCHMFMTQVTSQKFMWNLYMVLLLRHIFSYLSFLYIVFFSILVAQ